MPDCIVVGGGIIGLLTARELHKQNIDVLLIERGTLGGESSWAGGGIISPLYPWFYHDAINELAQIGKKIYPKLVSELEDETGVDCELIQSGLLIAEKCDEQQTLDWINKWMPDTTVIDDFDKIKKIEPAINPSVSHGIWMPDIMQVRNPKLVAALKLSFDSIGLKYLQNSPVDELIIKNNKACGVRVGGQKILSKKIIVASGAWSSKMLDATINVEPVKGQMIMYQDEPDRLHRLVLSEGQYVIPRADGKILVGSTIEKKGFDKSISEDAMQQLHDAAVKLIPALGSASIVRQWAGLRPGTQHGIPYICEHDEIEDLFINAGHYRNGIVLGPASAALMASLILENETSIEKSHFKMDALH